jgi:hypothetical protein
MKRALALLPLLAGSSFACGDGAPMVVGRVSSGVSATPVLEIQVNGERDAVIVEEDGTFEIESLPTGDVAIAFDTEHAGGELVLRDVKPNEVIEIVVTEQRTYLEVRIVRRYSIVEDDDTDSDSDSDSDSDGDSDWDRDGDGHPDEDWSDEVTFPDVG